MDSKIKNIAILCNSQSWGGLEMNVFRLAEWLAEAGHQVLFLAPENSSANQKAKENTQLKVSSFESGFKYGNIFAARKLKKILKKNQTRNILSSHSNDVNLMILTKIFSGNTLNVSYFQQMNLGRDKKDLFHTFFYKRLNHWISPLPNISKVTLTRTKVNKSQMRIIPLCIKIEKFDNVSAQKEQAKEFFKLDTNSKIVGTIGRIDKQKGQEFLIKAIHQLRQEGFDWEIVFVGEETKGEEGRYFPFLKDLVQELNMQEFVHFHSFTEKTELAFAALDIFAMTSYNETFGMVTIEAMASGLPVVGSDKGGTPHLVQDGKTGLLFESQNVDDLMNKLRILLQNPDKIIQMGEEGRKVAQLKYSHRTEVREIEKLML